MGCAPGFASGFVLGHLSRDRLSALVRSGVPVSELSPCMACKLGKTVGPTLSL